MGDVAGVLRKIKRPQGPHTYEFLSTEKDAFGHWLFLPRESGWTAPHDHGVLPFDVLVLVAPGSPLVTWWCDDPAGRRIEIDVSHPPIELDDGWSFIDLELDVVRYANGSLVVQDEHEFANACRGGYIDEAEAALAGTSQSHQGDSSPRPQNIEVPSNNFDGGQHSPPDLSTDNSNFDRAYARCRAVATHS